MPQPMPMTDLGAIFTPPPDPNAPPEPPDTRQGMWDSGIAALGDVNRETRQLATGQAFSATEAPPQVERTPGGRIVYGLTHSAPTLASMFLGTLGGGAAGTAVGGPVGGVVGGLAGGALGGSVTDFAQSLIPAYEDALRQGLDHDAAVNQAYHVAEASGAFTGLTAPLFGLRAVKSVVGNLLFHAAVTGPGTGAIKQGVIDPAITGQPTPSVDEMIQGAIENAIGGGVAGGVMHYGQHYGSQLATRLRGGATTSGDGSGTAPPPSGQGTPPTAPATEPPPIPSRPTPFTDLVRPPPEGVAPGEAVPITTPMPSPEPPPIPPRETPPDVTTAQPRPGEPAAAPVIPEPPAAVPTGEPAGAETARPGMEPTAGPIGTVPVDAPGVVRPPVPPPERSEGGAEPALVAPEPPAPGVEPGTEPGEHQPGAPLANGFFTGPEPGDRFRVGPTASVNGALLLEKRSGGGSVSSFFLGKDGNLIDADTVRLDDAASRDRLWTPETPERAAAATAILREMGALPLTAPRRLELRARLRRLVTGEEPPGTAPVPGQGEPVPGQAEPRGTIAEPIPITPEPTPSPGSTPSTPRETPGTPAYKLDELDRINAPDEAYRDALSTGSKDPLKPGETWRDRLVKWVDQERAAATAGEPETSAQGANAPGTTPAAPLAAQETPGTLESRAGFRRKAPAPGEPERLPPRAKPQPELEPVVTPQVGDPLTFEDHAYSPGTPEYRKAFHDALRGSGRDPETMVNAPIGEQIRVLAKQLEDEYGFAKVDVDPKVDPKVTRDQLLNMHQNMNNMAAALGWSRETIALNGRLALHMVPKNFRGESWYGAYSFADKTIHISGGSNSYAHEHWHAIDDHLTDLLHNNPNKQQLLSWSAKAGALDPKDPVQSAFARVLNAMSYNRGEEMLRRLRLEQTARKTTAAGQPTAAALAARREIENLDKGASRLRIGPSDLRTAGLRGPNPQYWASAHELFARVGEAYTAYRMEAAGHDTAGVVKSNKAYQDRALAEIRHRYPNWMDRLDMFHAFDELTTELDRASTLSRSQPKATPTSEMYDLKPWGTRPADMKPGMLTSLRQDLGALRWSNLFAKDHEAIFHDPEAPRPPPTYDTRKGEKQGLPTDKSLAVRKADDIAMTWNSALGNLERIIRQLPPKARPYIQALRDKLGVDPGSGRLIGRTYEERTRAYERPDVSQFEDILKDNGLVGRITKRPYLTAEQNAMLRHTLTTGEMTYPQNARDLTGTGPRLQIPPEIRRAAAAIRSHVLDAQYDRMKAAGMDVPYAKSGYFPRVYNDKAILADHAGFVRDRTKLNQVIFDKDLGAQPDSVARLNQWWRETDASTRNSGLFDPAARDAMNQTTRNLRRITAIDEELAAGGAINPTTHDPTALRAERDKLVQENQDLHDLWRDHVRDQLAGHEAENVYDAIASGSPTRFNTLGPDSKFTKGRTLPPEADQIMRNWMHTNVLDMIPSYVHGVSRKVAFTELFGQDGHGIQKAVNDAIELGGMHSAFNEPIKKIVETVTGRSMRSNNPALERITNLASSVGALITLPGASISAIGEPFGTLLAGGSPKMLFKTFTNMGAAALRTGTAAERMAVLRAIGGTQSRLQGAASASRFSDYSGSPTIEKFMHNYFELALSPAVRWIRAATLGAGTDHMKVLLRLATDPAQGRSQLNRQADAKTLLRDWFINDAQMPEMRKFLESFPDLPTREAIENHPMGGLYEVAANRMLNRMSQDPTAAEKPMGALQNPMVNMMAQLTAFPYGFWRNVMEPVLHKAGHVRQREWDRQIAQGASPTGAAFQAEAARFKSWVGTAVAGMALLAGTGLMYVPRTYLFNHPAWKKHEDDGDLGDWLLSNTVSASGMAGPMDAIGQAITSLRYRSDTSALMEGPYLATEMRYLTDIVKGVGHAISGKGGVGTNTEVYNAVQALGQLTAKPAFLAGLTKLSTMVPAGGPLSGLLAAMSVAGTSTTVSRAITDSVAGERGTTIKKEPKDPYAPPPLEGLPPLDESVSGQENAAAGGLPSWMLGLTDDVLMPMLKIVPGAGKVAIGAVAGASGVGLLGYRGHQYKTQGEPPKKAH
jgi:hypothetical protein